MEVPSEGKTLLERSRERRNAWLSERLCNLDGADRESIARAVSLLEDFLLEEVVER